jgi:hypothetical protein
MSYRAGAPLGGDATKLMVLPPTGGSQIVE